MCRAGGLRAYKPYEHMHGARYDRKLQEMETQNTVEDIPLPLFGFDRAFDFERESIFSSWTVHGMIIALV